MILAKVTGHVVATQKCDELRGSNLLLITQLDDNQQLMKDRSWVAVDSDRYKAMSVVAIVEKVFRDA